MVAPQESDYSHSGKGEKMTQGLTTAKAGVTVSNEGERFKAPRPAFQAPKNAPHLEPKYKENVPAPSLASQASVATSEMVKRALLAASQAAKTETPDTYGKPRQKRAAKVETVEVKIKGDERPKYEPEDVCDDRTFIVKTRSGDYHTPEMKRLFWANGGERFMVAGLTYAQAFTNLRTEKMRNIRK
jgi:hypothetical protein